jgi:hypothetical protein
MYQQAVNFLDTEQPKGVPCKDTDVYQPGDLQHWAAKLPEENEIYPNFWRLRGWRCIQAPQAVVQ